MAKRSIVIVLGLVIGGAASADPLDEDVNVIPDTRPPGEVKPAPRLAPRLGVRTDKDDAGPWGGGVQVTGMSGIGALPGRNFGGEVAAYLRHEQVFGQLALGRYWPQKDYVVTETAQRTPLALDTWSMRGGWAPRDRPLRGWLLAEVGQLANPDGMLGGIARTVTMSMPADRRWLAVGAGFGVAWPMSKAARLVGTFELAVPVDRKSIMLDSGRFEPDPATARCALGLEVGWR